uniref:CRAL-TRIO domain-containing protein n=1 Tax=Romanomermis culicivorax TaxID=13658 RepID=A0A915IB64_ROMCU
MFDFRQISISHKFGKRIQQATYIIDLKGLGAQHLWKPGLDAFLEIAHLVEQHTPEIMYKLFIINENYKEALLNFVDPNQLPINYGGTVEINGDPTCSQHITYGGIVPKEVIEKEKENSKLPEVNYIALKVKAGTYAQVSLIISEQDKILEWFIASDSTHDIFFGIFRTDIDNKETCTDKMEMITPYYRIYTYYVPETGHIKARPGKYILHFDNSHSWVTGKTIKYAINVIDGDN